MVCDMAFPLGQEKVHGLFFEVELLVRLFNPFGYKAYGVGQPPEIVALRQNLDFLREVVGGFDLLDDLLSDSSLSQGVVDGLGIGDLFVVGVLNLVLKEFDVVLTGVDYICNGRRDCVGVELDRLLADWDDLITFSHLES